MRDEEHDIAKRSSIQFDREVSIRSRVSHKKATKSIDRMDSEIKKSMDTIELYKNWQTNFSNICDKKLSKLQAANSTRSTVVSKVQPSQASPKKVPLPKISVVEPTKQARPCELRRRQQAASSQQPRRPSPQMIRGIPYRPNRLLPNIVKPSDGVN